MRWILALTAIAASSLFLYTEYGDMIAARNAPPPPPVLTTAPAQMPLLDAKELKSLHDTARDPDPGVRWTSIQLLYTMKDPDSLTLLEKTVAEDSDVDVRMKAVKLLNEGGTSRQVPALVKGLADLEPDVRIAALKALGDIGDPAAAPWVAALLKDPENNVKTEALHTLGRFQEKRMKDFQNLTDQLRHQYEAAVKKSQQNSQ